MKKKTPGLVFGIVLFLLLGAIALFDPLQTVQWKISDLLFRSSAASDLITVIAIDEKSTSPAGQLGRFRDWPRSLYSQLLRTLGPHKPAVVAYDLDFRESARGLSGLRLAQLLRDYERRLSSGGGAGYQWYELLKRFEGLEHPDDVDFVKAAEETGVPVVLPSTLLFGGLADDGVSGAPLAKVSEPGEFPVHTGVVEPVYKGGNITTGFANVFPDRDGVLRRFVPWVASATPGAADTTGVSGSEGLSGFPAAIMNVYVGRSAAGEDSAPASGTLLARIAYSTRPFSYRTLSFSDVLAGNFEPTDIAGKIVLVGATAASIQDFQTTPTSKIKMPGVEVLANIIQQMLETKEWKEQGSVSLLILLALITMVGGMLFFKLQLSTFAVIFAVMLFAYPFAAFGLFQRGYILNVVYPELAWVLTAIAVLWYRNQTEFKEKKMIERAFSHYVSPVVVGELVKSPETLKLGGSRKPISVLFSDIVGFTSFAEKLSPEDTVALLNDYLTAMTEIVFEHQGTLDKYQGDAIMALFGAPLADEHHAANACLTALGMRRALTMLHEKWNMLPNIPFKDQLIQLDFRVGIASGDAVVGNVGSEKRFDYTAIGDIVNLGSRLESVNRKYGTHVIVDKPTFVAVTENHNPFVFRKLDIVRVKGKQDATEIFEVVALAENASSDLKSALDDFENGRILYTQRNFIEAGQYFEAVLGKLPNDGPAQIYRNRCNYFLRKPPAREWDGVVGLEEK